MDGSGQTQIPQRHMCHCGKGFLRKEHLRRHQATHRERTHACPVCPRSFTRNDLLRRHLNLHKNVTPPSMSRNERACDLCHEKRTKCSGGSPCKLCATRGIGCTYNRHIVTQAAEDEDEDEDEEEEKEEDSSQQEYADPMIEASASQNQAVPAGLLTNEVSTFTDFSQTTPVIPPTQFDNGVTAALNGLRFIIKAVATFRSNELPPLPLHDISEAEQSWILACHRTGFSRFHERWPFIHACILDEKTESAVLMSSVVIVGSWYHDPGVVRKCTVQAHQFTVTQLLAALLEPTMPFDDSKPWPIQIWRSALLQIILAFEIGREDLMYRARRLLSLLITSLRDSGALLPLGVTAHQKKHFPGNYPPWVYMWVEGVKRIVFCAFKVDVYYAIFFDQSPFLQAEELEHSVLSSFALWNSNGLPIFFDRCSQEPTYHTQCMMADILLDPQSVDHSVYLVEDVHLGLCGTFQGLWRSRQTQRRNVISATMAQEPELHRQRLDAFRLRLHGFDKLRRKPQDGGAELIRLLKAYQGEVDEESGSACEKESWARLSLLIFNAIMLYHLLGLQSHTDIRMLNTVIGGTWGLKQPLTTPIPPGHGAESQVYQWASSQRGRMAVMEAITALATYESFQPDMPNQQGRPIDPIVYISLAHAAMIVQAWITYRSDKCTCQQTMSRLMVISPTLSLERTSEQEQWITNGSELAMDGVMLCRCNLEAWLDRFMSAILQGSERWEMGGVIAGSHQAQQSGRAG